MVEGEEWAYNKSGEVTDKAIEHLRAQLKLRPLTQSETELLFEYIQQQLDYIEVLRDIDD